MTMLVPGTVVQDTDDSVLASFGERLRDLRARRGMSRRLLAGGAGLSERYVAQLESGAGNPSFLVLRALAAALDIPVDTLIAPTDEPDDFQRIVALARNLGPAQLARSRDRARGRDADGRHH